MYHLTTALLLTILFAAAVRADEPDRPRILVVSLEDHAIHPITARFLTRAVRQANERRCHCVIIQLDTPGGDLESTRRIAKDIFNSDVPVVVYVAPSGGRALAAGVFITLAAHVAVMAPGTNIGTAHPIAQHGGPLPGVNDILGKDGARPGVQDILNDRITNDAVAWARALAEHRNRNAGWAVRAVRESISTPAQQALQENVIDFIAADQKELLSLLDGRKVSLIDDKVVLHTKDAIIERLEMSWPERLLGLLANPTLAYLLLLVGFAGVMFEITHPGVWIPGILGAVCLVVAFFAMQLLPINYAGLALILLGLVLIVMEVKVVSYGILTIVSIVCLLSGSAMLIEPAGGVERVSWLAVAPVSIALVVIMLLLLTNVVRAHKAKVQTGMEGLIGTMAKVSGELNGVGYVQVAGELWKARSDLPLQDGETVRIEGYEGLTLYVKPGPF